MALWPSGLGNYFISKRFAVQTLLWSLEFVVQINLQHDTITTLEMWVNSAILNFNDGSKGLLDVLNYFDLSGAVTINKGVQRDTARLKQAICKSSEGSKKRNPQIHEKGYLDKEKEKKKLNRMYQVVFR